MAIASGGESLLQRQILNVYELPRLRRHHRWLTAPSGVVLFLCLFLPALRVCNDPVYPVQFPMFWTPYIAGILVGVGAFVGMRRAAGFGAALLVVLWLTVLGWGAFVAASITSGGPWGLLIAVSAGSAILLAATQRPVCEASLPRAGAITGFLCVLWFGGMSTDRTAMIGAYLSLAASVGMTIGCLWWWFEI